jgi:hypothetical protein
MAPPAPALGVMVYSMAPTALAKRASMVWSAVTFWKV